MTFKVIVIGESGVGKTCLLVQLTEQKFYSGTTTTIGVNFTSMEYDFDSTTVRLKIWDTAGQEIFRSMTKTYYRGSSCAIIVYDVTSSESFERVDDWIKDVKEFVKDEILLILVGNKVDLEDRRKISTESGQNFANENNMLFYETSALTGSNVQEIFKKCAKKSYKKHSKEKKLKKADEKIITNLEDEDEKKKKKCC
ncbi:ras and ef-hand domain-containing protein [Anaeramoeba flamelloides]|uniref:Ras and ef-hand domain-containing protein n=1 Tax=Anaeramoeba flamelloides TaxID=1746091 RepID=A0AAV7Z1X1_9EUKA|nr:ras and ef-hand domain-containing protein [Anaeramoeba flamelloides]